MGRSCELGTEPPAQGSVRGCLPTQPCRPHHWRLRSRALCSEQARQPANPRSRSLMKPSVATRDPGEPTRLRTRARCRRAERWLRRGETSLHPWLAPSVEHPHGLRLITLRSAEESVELLARLLLVGVGPGASEALCARLRRNDCGQVGELLGLERDELVAGLRGLKAAHRRLTRRHERIGLDARGIEVLDNAGLDVQRILVACKRVLPALLRAADKLLR